MGRVGYVIWLSELSFQEMFFIFEIEIWFIFENIGLLLQLKFKFFIIFSFILFDVCFFLGCIKIMSVIVIIYNGEMGQIKYFIEQEKMKGQLYGLWIYFYQLVVQYVIGGVKQKD